MREAEAQAAWLAVARAPIRPMPTAMIGALAVRGVYLRRAIEREGIPTLETWPAGVLTQMTGDGAVKRSSSTDPQAYVAWATQAMDGRVRTMRDDMDGPDEVDAVAAGLAGWLHATDAGCEHVGSVETGFICVPTVAAR